MQTPVGLGGEISSAVFGRAPPSALCSSVCQPCVGTKLVGGEVGVHDPVARVVVRVIRAESLCFVRMEGDGQPKCSEERGRAQKLPQLQAKLPGTVEGVRKFVCEALI